MNPVRFSELKWMAKSPAHYRYYADHPPKQTKALRFGEALDALVFGTKEVLAYEGSSRRGKAWDIFADEHPEAVLLLAPEQEQVAGMLAAVQAHKEAMEFLSGTCQKTIAWKMRGRDCRGTPDVIRREEIVELKTTRNANPDKFPWDGRYLGYHAQLAWYLNGVNVAGVSKAIGATIVAVESSPPYPVTIFHLSERALLEGTKLWRIWFERLLVCEENGIWPAYTQSAVPFDTPELEGLTLRIGGEETEVESDQNDVPH